MDLGNDHQQVLKPLGEGLWRYHTERDPLNPPLSLSVMRGGTTRWHVPHDVM